jgi:transcriptional regulator with XRE-family HTH domain
MKDNDCIEHNKLFGERAKELRDAKHWSQQAVADEAGLKVSVICTIEKGTRSIHQSTKNKLFRGLGVTEEEYMDTDGFRALYARTHRLCLVANCCRQCLASVSRFHENCIRY